MLRIAIIEDESAAFKLLNTILTEYCEDVEVSAHARDVASGIDAILRCRPDVIFVDVQLGEKLFLIF